MLQDEDYKIHATYFQIKQDNSNISITDSDYKQIQVICLHSIILFNLLFTETTKEINNYRNYKF